MEPLPPYPDRFYAAARYAAIPGTVEVPPGMDNPNQFQDLICLALYSLFQQAVHGPCTAPKPWGWNLVELAKWQGWKELKDMAPVEAMRLFVRTLEEEDPGWWATAQSLEKAAAAATAAVESSSFSAFTPNGTAVATTPHPFVEAELAPELLSLVKSNSWVTVPTKGQKPAARYQHASVLLNNKLYIVGGNTGRFVNDVQVLDLCSLSWNRLELSTQQWALPPTAGLSLIIRDENTLYALGGHSKDGSQQLIVRAFDLQTLSWSVVKTNGDPPSARGGHSTTLIGSCLWVFGGEDSKRVLLNDVHSLDLATLTWERRETSGVQPSPRAEHSSTAYNDRYLTVFGGGSHSLCFNDINVLDTETLEWMTVDSFGSIPSPRAGHASVCLFGLTWFTVGGGDNKDGISETLALELDTLTWTVVAKSPLRSPLASEGLSLEYLDSPSGPLLLAFGGYNGKYSNDLSLMRLSLTSEGRPSSSAPSTPSAITPLYTPGGQLQPSTSSSSLSVPASPLPVSSSSFAPPLSSLPPAAESTPLVQGQQENGEEKSHDIPDEAAATQQGSGPQGVSSTQSGPSTQQDSTTGEAAGGALPVPSPALPAPLLTPTPEVLVVKQLEEAESALQRAEKIALNARAEANLEAGQARADAWASIAKATLEMGEMKKELAAAHRARQEAEDEARDGQAEVLAAKAAQAAAQTEAQKLRKDLAETRSRMRELDEKLAGVETSEVTKVQKDFALCKTALVDTQQELGTVRASLVAEQARCFKLEVEVAELRQRLSHMSDLELELELMRRQMAAAEVAIRNGEGGAKSGGGGWWR